MQGRTVREGEKPLKEGIFIVVDNRTACRFVFVAIFCYLVLDLLDFNEIQCPVEARKKM